MAVDLDKAEARFRRRFEEDKPLLDRLAQTAISSGETRQVAQANAIFEQGLAKCMSRLTSVESKEDRVRLVTEFADYGPKAVLLTGSQRGGDFLNNQLRGQWAERVVLSLDIPGYTLVPFGPSAAAMPGEEDHRETIMTFRAIILLEGKRPDLLAFEDDVWSALSQAEQDSALDWPERQLELPDDKLVAQAACGIEVKNSTWHYATRRAAGGGPLSITVKDEELSEIDGWEDKTGLPVVFVQVLFDELYCMSFQRMQDAIARGHLYSSGDLISNDDQGAGGKNWHRFHVDGGPHFLGTVEFPEESEAAVAVLDDGSVVPHIRYAPAQGACTSPEAFSEEIEYAGTKKLGLAL